MTDRNDHDDGVTKRAQILNPRTWFDKALFNASIDSVFAK